MSKSGLGETSILEILEIQCVEYSFWWPHKYYLLSIKCLYAWRWQFWNSNALHGYTSTKYNMAVVGNSAILMVISGLTSRQILRVPFKSCIYFVSGWKVLLLQGHPKCTLKSVPVMVVCMLLISEVELLASLHRNSNDQISSRWPPGFEKAEHSAWISLMHNLHPSSPNISPLLNYKVSEWIGSYSGLGIIHSTVLLLTYFFLWNTVYQEQKLDL